MLGLIVESGLRSMILIAIVIAVLGCLRIRNPHTQYWVWLVTLSASLFMPVALRLSVIEVPAASAIVWDAPVVAAMLASPTNHQWLLAAIYLAVGCMLALRLVIGLCRTALLTRRATRVREYWTRGIDVRETAAVRSPVTFASAILLPSDWQTWDRVKLAAVIAHEVTHVRHYHFHSQYLAHIYRAIFWFNPFAWWLPKQLANLGEMISDDAAILSIADRTQYAAILVDVSRGAQSSHNATATAIAMARHATVASRVERALHSTTIFQEPGRVLKVATALCMLPLLGLIASRSHAVGTDAVLNSSAKEPATTPIYAVTSKPPGTVTDKKIPPKLPPQGLSQPPYPSEEKGAGHTGTVYLRVQVDATGHVAQASIKTSSGFPALDESAATAAMKWEFIPARQNNSPVDMWIVVPVKFALALNKLTLQAN